MLERAHTLIDDLVISGMIDQKAEVPLKAVVIVPYDMRFSHRDLAQEVAQAIRKLCREGDPDQWEEDLSKSKIVLLGVDNNMFLDSVLNSADRFGIGTFEVNAVAAFGPCSESSAKIQSPQK